MLLQMLIPFASGDSCASCDLVESVSTRICVWTTLRVAVPLLLLGACGRFGCSDANMVSQDDFHGDTDWKVTVAKMVSGVENVYAIKTVTDFHLMVSHVSLWLKVKR